MNVEPMFDGIKMQSEGRYENRRYIGSIDPLTAINWAKECGHPLYSKEWKEYALGKLKSNEYQKFQANVAKRYV